MRDGACPKCGKSGSPVDVRVSHRAISLLVVTRWSSHKAVCCRRCHVRALLGNTLITLLLGWWGFPFGLLMTPVQVLRNLYALARIGSGLREPSAELEELVAHKISIENTRPVGVLSARAS